MYLESIIFEDKQFIIGALKNFNHSLSSGCIDLNSMIVTPLLNASGGLQPHKRPSMNLGLKRLITN